jgi:hypothetical protein
MEKRRPSKQQADFRLPTPREAQARIDAIIKSWKDGGVIFDPRKSDESRLNQI